MEIEVEVSAQTAFAKLEGVSARVRDRFTENLKPIEEAMLTDARTAALAHFHSVGKKPGLYLGAFEGGVHEDDKRVVGWVRNANPLAHLLEYGFTISDLMIEAGGIMKFEAAGVGELYRRAVHRHATAVQAYPAIKPAFDAHKGEIQEAAERAVEGL